MSTQPNQLGALELLEETLRTTAQLAEKQLELLRAELTQTIAEERRRLIMTSIGVSVASAGIAVLLVAASLAAGLAIGHAALFTLCVGVVVCGIAATLLTLGLRGLTQAQLPSSRLIVEEEIKWAKEKLDEKKSSSSPETSNGSVAAVNR